MLTWISDLLKASGTSNAFSSLGVMGPVIGLIVYGLNAYFGVEVLPDAEAVQLVSAGTVIWTVVTAAWGRMRATKKIGGGELA